MAKYLKEFTCTLHDLAMNFHSLMLEENAKYFTVENFGNTQFWYIADVRQDGTYPCHPTDGKGNVYYPKFIDYTRKVTIHFK